MSAPATVPTPGLWEKYLMALDNVTGRLQRITRALEEAAVPYALVGGQAVALWVATKDPAAVRTTNNVDVLLRRGDLPRARAAATAAGMDYFEVVGVGMFLERSDPNPRRAVHLVWADEKVTPDCTVPSPAIEEREQLQPGTAVVSLPTPWRSPRTSTGASTRSPRGSGRRSRGPIPAGGHAVAAARARSRTSPTRN